MKKISLMAVVRAVENPGDKILVFAKNAVEVKNEIVKILNDSSVCGFLLAKTTKDSVLLLNRAEITIRESNRMPYGNFDQVLIQGMKTKTPDRVSNKAIKHLASESQNIKFIEKEFSDLFDSRWKFKRKAQFSGDK